jgi:hypothetical protein
MRDLEPFFARYAERYMASDVDAVSAMHEAPMLALREGRVIHLADKTAVRAHLADVMPFTRVRAQLEQTSPRSTSFRSASQACSLLCGGRCVTRAAASLRSSAPRTTSSW